MRGKIIHTRHSASGFDRSRSLALLRVRNRLDLLKLVATCLIAVSLVMRASVPVGWMPNSAAAPGQAALIPCPMMDGMRGIPMPPLHHEKHQPAPVHEGSICPFATPPQPILAVVPQDADVVPARSAFLAPAVSRLAPHWDHAPRAPPGQGDRVPA